MADLDTSAQAEAERRVREALDHIQNAQLELGRAAAALSSLQGGAGVWSATGKLYDRVHAHWYRVQTFQQRGRFSLDGIASKALERSGEVLDRA